MVDIELSVQPMPHCIRHSIPFAILVQEVHQIRLGNRRFYYAEPLLTEIIDGLYSGQATQTYYGMHFCMCTFLQFGGFIATTYKEVVTSQ